MKKFDYSTLYYMSKHFSSTLVGQYINRLFLVSEHDFYLSLAKRNTGLFISLNNSNPFIELITEKINFPKIKKDSHLTTIFTHHLEHSKITDVALIDGQKVLVLTLNKHYENLTERVFKLYIELITAHPNLIVVDEHEDIVSLYRASKHFQAERILRIAQPYHLKEINKKFLVEDVRNLNDFTAQYLADNHLAIMRKNHSKLFSHIKASIKRLTNKKKNIANELAKMPDSQIANYYGQLLLTYKPEINDEKVSIFEEEIEVDPSLDAIRNATIWFNRAKKTRSAVINKKIQVEQIDQELSYYQTLAKQIQLLDDEGLNEVEIELNINSKSFNKKSNASSIKPYYVNYKNIRIAFGKNNLQNDYLSFKLANKSDTFMHIRNNPGSHIVIFTANPDQHLLSIAAQIGLYLAKIPSGEFTYTKCKNIKKGPFPGSVVLKEETTIYQRENTQQIKQIMESIQRF